MLNCKLEKLLQINMDYSKYFQELKTLAHSFNEAAPSFLINNQYEVVDLELNEGFEIDFSQVETHHDLLSYQGRQVLLYIKDHSYGDNFNKAIMRPGEGNRFHVADCSTLESMRSRRRFERYVVTNNVSGEFKISNGSQEGLAQLRVCQNCLKMLNYKGSKGDFAKSKENAAEFDLSEFFATYSSFFMSMPKGRDDDLVSYTLDWAEVSRKYRESKNYTCNKCAVYLGQQSQLCHVHHINGVKSDNHTKNLEVLCADCHRKEHIDHMYVGRSDMRKIAMLRAEQGIGANADWDTALRLVEPALYGDLEALRRKRAVAPQIHYRVKNPTTGEVVVFDAAWPQDKIALSLDSLIVNEWQVYGFRSYLRD